MPQFPTNTRLSDRAQHRIVQDLLQSRRSGQLTRAEIHQDMRNLIEVGVRPNVLFDHYQIPADERRHYRNTILNRPITPVELNALPEPSSPGMDRDMQRTTWNRLRRKHYPNLPSPSTSPSAASQSIIFEQLFSENIFFAYKIQFLASLKSETVFRPYKSYAIL
jgi:hypothetical protein